MICRNGRLLTGSVGKNLRMWTLTGVSSMRSADNPSMPIGGLTMEDEMNLDGSVVAAAFDESLDMVSLLHEHLITIACYILANMCQACVSIAEKPIMLHLLTLYFRGLWVQVVGLCGTSTGQRERVSDWSQVMYKR